MSIRKKNSRPYSRRTAEEQQKDTNKNVKKEKKENNVKNIEEQFEIFWNYYHETTNKPKTDRDAAFKYFKQLTLEERRKAYEKVEDYKRSVNDPKYIKKARTYLADRNFNDELRPAKREQKRPQLPNLKDL